MSQGSVSAQYPHARVGLAYGLLAYLVWGMGPVIFKQLEFADPFTITAHRAIWSLVILMALLLQRDGWRSFGRLFSNGRQLCWLALSSFLIGLNWLVFVWAVNNARILETSLGYFITPLVSIVLGMLFLGEKLRGYEWIALLLAGTGTIWLTVVQGTLPWVSLVLAFSFGFYALAKKNVETGAVRGVFVETVFMFIPAVVFLVHAGYQTGEPFLGRGAYQDFMLVGGGLITCIPLLAFAGAVRRLPLSALGFLQYLAPSLSALVAVFIYAEPFTSTHAIVFAFIWIGLIIYSLGILHRIKRRNRTA